VQVGMRAFVCHCRQHLEAQDDDALCVVVREHLIRNHPTQEASEEQVREIVSRRAYTLEYAHVGYEDGIGPDEEFGCEPY
jgi:hypothetical protein